MNRILVVDDDLDLCELLAKYLQREGFEFDMVHNGSQAVERALGGNYALVILDVMLPGMNGFEILRSLRNKSNLPVLMLTARGDDIDRIVGLEMGADDYLPKPFNHELADLGRDFDMMAERLQGLMNSQQRLLHDISHELRSPLTRLKLSGKGCFHTPGPSIFFYQNRRVANFIESPPKRFKAKKYLSKSAAMLYGLLAETSDSTLTPKSQRK
jgi:CheY-like chemotaxis protein